MAKKFDSMRLSMKEVQVMDVEEAQIVSQLDSSIKLARDIIVGPFETVEMKGILQKLQITIKE